MIAHPARDGGWLRFAIAMLLVSAVANSLYGVVGLVGDDHLVSDALLFGAVEFWGGVSLVVGITELMIVLLLVKRVPSGVPLGITVAGLNAVAQMMAIGAYPLWGVTVLVIDALVIYGLAVHGTREPA